MRKLIQFTSLNTIKETLIPSIISKILNIFENVIKLKDQDSTVQKRFYEIDFEIVNLVL